MRYHGNFCGPNWSDGREQASICAVDGAVDVFDETCRVHDCAYANSENLDAADRQFIDANLFVGVKPTIAALAVATNYVTRTNVNNSLNTVNMSTKKSTQKLRGSNPQKQQNKRVNNNTAGRSNASQSQLISVPAAIGTVLSGFAPTITRGANSVSLSGREYGADVAVVNSTTFGCAASIALSPAYFQSAMLGVHAKAHEEYRFRSILVQYIPAVPTSSAGQVILLSSNDILEPFLQSSSASFLARAMTQRNAILGPIWQKMSTTIKCDNTWRSVDCFVESDINDNILGEIQAYGWGSTTQSAGSLIIDYKIEFREPVYQPHQTAIPDSLGPSSVLTAVDNSAVNAIAAAFSLTQSVLTAYSGGYIFRMVFRQSASVLPTGVGSWGALARVSLNEATASGAASVNLVNIAMAEGSTFYGLISATGGNVVLYADLHSAIAAGYTGLVTYQTATTAIGSYSFICTTVHVAPSLTLTTQ